LVATLPDDEGIIIDAEGVLHYSEGLAVPAIPEARQPMQTLESGVEEPAS